MIVARYYALASLAAFALATAGSARAEEASRGLSVLKPARIYAVTGGEDWKSMTGFGKEADRAEMMILMMVGGSGMEGMRMGSMTKMPGHATSAKPSNQAEPRLGANGELTLKIASSPEPPVVGENALVLTVTDASGHPMKGLKIDAAVAMTSMDMGTDHPKATDRGSGRYEIPARFSMKGPWRLTLTVSPPGAKAFVKAFDFDIAR